MEWYLCFLVLELLSRILFIQTHANLHLSIVTKTEANWTEASNQCELETPPIQFSWKHNIVNIHGYSEISMWASVWVGYIMEWKTFEYIGCVNKAEMFRKVIPTFLHTKNDPGQCYSACGYSEFFGLLLHECFCLTKITVSAVKNKRQVCNQCLNGLETPQGPACGSYRYTSHIALYKVNQEVDKHSDIPTYEPSSTPDQVCLGYIPTNDSYIWAKCATRMKIMCKYDDGSVRATADWASWIGSMIKCFGNGSDPVTFADARYVEKESKEFWMWTGVVRGQVIYRYTDQVHPIRYNITWFGYVTKYPLDGFVLEFTPTDLEKRALCTSGNSMTTSSVIQTKTETGASAGITDRTSDTSLTTLETTIEREAKSASETESNVPVYVLILVVVVFMLVIVGLVALLLWKYQKHKNKYSRDKEGSVNGVAFSNINTDSTESAGTGGVSHNTDQAASLLRQHVADDHYEEPLSIETTNRFHYYDSPPSNQPTTTSDHFVQLRPAGVYQPLGPRNVNNYAMLHN